MATPILLHISLIDKVILLLIMLAYQKAKKKAQNAAWHARHREEAKTRNAERHARHRDEDNAKSAAYRAAHREELHAKNAEWRTVNSEKVKALNAAWYENHREEARMANAAWRAAHREEAKATSRAWHATHREEARVKNAAWRATHREEVRIKNAAWRATHQNKLREYRKAHAQEMAAAKARRIARKRGAPVSDFTAAQRKMVKEHYGYHCVYCGKKFPSNQLTMDHITPLIKGGSHTLSNIVPACGPCNSKKQAGPVLKPVQPLLLVEVAVSKPSRKK